MTETPIYNELYDATAAASKTGRVIGATEMKQQILEILKDRKRIDAALLKKIEDLKCF